MQGLCLTAAPWLCFAGRLGTATRQVPSSPSSHDRWALLGLWLVLLHICWQSGHLQDVHKACWKRQPRRLTAASRTFWEQRQGSTGSQCDLQGAGGRTLGPVS